MPSFFLFSADKETTRSSKLLYFTWAPQGKGKQVERLAGFQRQELSPALPHSPTCNICRPVTCKLTSVLSRGASLGAKATAAKFSQANFSSPKWRIHLSDMKHDLKFLSAHLHAIAVRNFVYILVATGHEITRITIFLLAYSHNGSYLLSVKVLLTCISLDSLVWSFHFFYYQEQQEIPSEIKKKYGQLFLFAPQRTSFGGRFLHLSPPSHGDSCCFCQLSDLFFPKVVGGGSLRQRGGTETQQRTVIFQKLLESHPFPDFLPNSSFKGENISYGRCYFLIMLLL